MNTPYPELLSDPAAQLAALLHWNTGIERARVEYAAHPFAACGVVGCDRLAVDRWTMCNWHAGHNQRTA